MAKPLNPSLYARVKRDAKRRFARWPSAYGSAWLAREYKRLGGQWSSSPSQGVGRWMAEEWVQVEPYVTTGKRVPCGSGSPVGKACRPLHRKSPRTPVTMREVLKEHGAEEVLRMARRKSRSMDRRMRWSKHRRNFRPSRGKK